MSVATLVLVLAFAIECTRAASASPQARSWRTAWPDRDL